jgi:thioredoxin reductase (NADPH)
MLRMNLNVPVLIIGAGPTGLSCAIELKKAGIGSVIVDKGCLVNSLYRYPANMVFFTTKELLEIGNIPFALKTAKPTREDALEYYRRVAEHYQLNVRQYERVLRVQGSDGDFTVHTIDRYKRAYAHRAQKLIVATGYYDLPNRMNVPGEDLPKVFHYYTEAHPFFGLEVLVVGGKNSAAEAALDLWRHGARVTLVHRGSDIHQNIKYWVKPDIENRIAAGEVKAYFNSRVREILPDAVVLDTPAGELRLKNDFVFAMTGYHPDFPFLQSLNIELQEPENRPVCDPQTLESNVPGVHVAGVILAGSRTNEIFIENGRFHGRQIATALAQKFVPAGASSQPLETSK